MTKKPTSIRLSKLGEKQLLELTEKTGMNQTEVIGMAINNFYEKMEDEMNEAYYLETDPSLWGMDDPDEATELVSIIADYIAKHYPLVSIETSANWGSWELEQNNEKISRDIETHMDNFYTLLQERGYPKQ